MADTVLGSIALPLALAVGTLAAEASAHSQSINQQGVIAVYVQAAQCAPT